MKMFKISAQLLGVCLLCQVQIMGETAPGMAPSGVGSWTPEVILKKAEEQEANLSTFYAELNKNSQINGYDAETRQVIYRKRSPDGQESVRIETNIAVPKLGKSIKNVQLTNADGTWEIDNNVAILEAFEGKRMQEMFSGVAKSMLDLTQPGKSAPFTLEMKESKVQGKDVYMVTMRMSDEIMKQWKTAMAKSMTVMPTAEQTPSVRQIIIGKSDLIIYGATVYSMTGSVISTYTWNTVKANLPLDDSLFQIPSALKKVTANSVMEEIQERRNEE